MKLSEAILLGSVGTEQGFGPYQNYGNMACALQAALIAVGRGDEHWARAGEQWPWTVLSGPAICPADGVKFPHVQAVIYVLNDKYRWARPLIAAYVESIEPQEEDTKCTTTLTTPNSSTCPVA
jgi:hypothetical protein